MTDPFAPDGATSAPSPAGVAFEPLTPTAFLDRAAAVFPLRTGVVDGDRRFTYAALHDRCLRLAGLLRDRGVRPGDRVAVLAPNSALLLEAHHGVPYAGAVLVPLNIRLAAAELAHVLEHSGATVLLVHPSLAALGDRLATAGVLVVRDEYETALAAAEPHRVPITDERGMLALNYTSGTTGRPKGVVYHHRGAYLQALAMATHSALTPSSVYLWTLPMFHCDGWCFTWGVAARGATHLCLEQVDPAEIWRLVHDEGVTHLCAAPTVLIAVAHHPDARPVEGRRVWVGTGGAPPSPALLARLDVLGFDVTHLYGLTETFGPAVICDWHPEWDGLSQQEQAERRARQGVGNVIAQAVRVVDADGRDVARDGSALGEIAVRGNDVMLGYYRDPEATAEAVPDGWFRTGDLAVLHPDGYVEIRDRAKDVIISGGENISSVEVEAALASHPAVLEAAVVPVPHERWGERPLAYVVLRAGESAEPDALRQHVRDHLAGFKVPDRVELVDDLPKTGTGKIQKFVLRERARQS